LCNENKNGKGDCQLVIKHSVNRDQIKVLLLEGVHKNAVEVFEQAGYTNLDYVKSALSQEELIERIQDVHILGIRSRSKITQEVLQHANKLITIGCFSIGTNQVDLRAAKMRGIPVFNAPYSNTRSVAELVVAECVMLLRGVPFKNQRAHEGSWLKTAMNSYEARGKKLGIVGYGHIGSQVSILAEAFGMQVYYYDLQKKLSLGNAIACSSLQEVLEVADVVTLHVPSTELTRKMIGVEEIAKMKRGSYLINASRGDVVDYDALAEALKNKHLLGAAADVFPEEPVSAQEPFKSNLQVFDNVILTPHIGGSTQEAQANIGVEVSEKMVKYSDTGSTVGAVNFVEIDLRENEANQRFLHIHNNVPGVLRAVNYVFTSRDINIASQFLQTDGDIGYVITDTESELDMSVLQELNEVPNTIKTRMLY
jgi:D-3-phosphoglycerate dehydrogenase